MSVLYMSGYIYLHFLYEYLNVKYVFVFLTHICNFNFICQNPGKKRLNSIIQKNYSSAQNRFDLCSQSKYMTCTFPKMKNDINVNSNKLALLNSAETCTFCLTNVKYESSHLLYMLFYKHISTPFSCSWWT